MTKVNHDDDDGWWFLQIMVDGVYHVSIPPRTDELHSVTIPRFVFSSFSF